MKIAMIGSGAAGSVFAAYLRRGGAEMTLVDRYQKHMDTCRETGLRFVTPEGEELLTGFQTAPSAAEIGIQDIVILMNPATWAAFKALAANASYGYDPFEGFEVIFTNDLKSFASASKDDVVIEIGDLKGVTANFPNGEGVDIKIDALSQAEYDLVKILGREFVGIGVTGPGKLVNVVKGE
jgi:hypothetical protein